MKRTPHQARDRMRTRYLLLRSDPFVFDAGVWLAVTDLAQAIYDAHESRRRWEEATGTPRAAPAEQLHRLAWLDMIDRLVGAAAAAGIDAENGSDVVSEVSGRDGMNRVPQRRRAGAADRTASGWDGVASGS